MDTNISLNPCVIYKKKKNRTVGIKSVLHQLSIFCSMIGMIRETQNNGRCTTGYYFRC